MMRLGKLNLYTKFEVASFSQYVNIEGNLQISGSSPVQGNAHFSSACDFMMGLGKRKLCIKFEVATASAIV